MRFLWLLAACIACMLCAKTQGTLQAPAPDLRQTRRTIRKASWRSSLADGVDVVEHLGQRQQFRWLPRSAELVRPPLEGGLQDLVSSTCGRMSWADCSPDPRKGRSHGCIAKIEKQ